MPVPPLKVSWRIRLTVDRTELPKKIIILESKDWGPPSLCSHPAVPSTVPACFGYNQYFVWQQQQRDFHSALSHPLPLRGRVLHGTGLSIPFMAFALKDKAAQSKRAASLPEPSSTKEALQNLVIAYFGEAGSGEISDLH